MQEKIVYEPTPYEEIAEKLQDILNIVQRENKKLYDYLEVLEERVHELEFKNLR